ncbi:MAG TPA: hypothetical protein VEH54_00990, partial [Steroidobacteraceae bacterium]|nr:hypothetical protein [Steroidobacteraceae bacterium]
DGGLQSDGRSLYQRGRAQMAGGDLVAARHSFEMATERGYFAARIELAQLLSDPSGGMPDLPRALGLYEQAYRDGVMIAGFELGALYEGGVSSDAHDQHSTYLLAPDEALAWRWYGRAADAGEPNALARLGEREADLAHDAADATQRNLHLLACFRFYAAAAERARREDWPDDAWRTWRYRRASLAHVLALAGMMQEAAQEYAGVRAR